MSIASLLWALLLGSVGLGYFLYGRNRKALVPALCGVVLMIFPYFVSNAWAMALLGVALMAVPYFLRF